MKLFDKLTRRKPDILKSFKESQENEEAFDARDKGVKEVELDRIVGSVGRYHDFDGRFRPKTDHHAERLAGIKQAMRSGRALPPVSLYQIKDEYYIMDGNHRVAAAKALGRETIRARILEFLPSQKTLENVLYREKAEFIERTGIGEPMQLTEVGQYGYLMKQIEDHQRSQEAVTRSEIPFRQAAADWFETVYKPFVEVIERSRLPESFPNRTVADLYAYISFHQWEKGRSRHYGIGLDEIIPRDMEAFRARMARCGGFDFPEMKRKITALVLINVEVGEEYRLMDRIFQLEEVKEIYDVPGQFDLIVKIVMERDWLSSDSEVIGYFVYNNIRKLDGVRNTQTLIPVSSKRK